MNDKPPKSEVVARGLLALLVLLLVALYLYMRFFYEPAN